MNINKEISVFDPTFKSSILGDYIEVKILDTDKKIRLIKAYTIHPYRTDLCRLVENWLVERCRGKTVRFIKTNASADLLYVRVDELRLLIPTLGESENATKEVIQNNINQEVEKCYQQLNIKTSSEEDFDDIKRAVQDWIPYDCLDKLCESPILDHTLLHTLSALGKKMRLAEPLSGEETSNTYKFTTSVEEGLIIFHHAYTILIKPAGLEMKPTIVPAASTEDKEVGSQIFQPPNRILLGSEIQPIRFLANIMAQKPLTPEQSTHFQSVCQKMTKKFGEAFPTLIQTMAHYETMLAPHQGTFRDGLFFYLIHLLQEMENECKNVFEEDKIRAHFDQMLQCTCQLILEIFEYVDNVAPEHNYGFHIDKRTLADLRTNSLREFRDLKKFGEHIQREFKDCHASARVKVNLNSWLQLKIKHTFKLREILNILEALILTDQDINIFTYLSRFACPPIKAPDIYQEIPPLLTRAFKVLEIVSSPQYQTLFQDWDVLNRDLQEEDQVILQGFNQKFREAPTALAEVFARKTASFQTYNNLKIESFFFKAVDRSFNESPLTADILKAFDRSFSDSPLTVEKKINSPKVSLVDMTVFKFHRLFKQTQMMISLYESKLYLDSHPNCTQELTLLVQALHNFSYCMRSFGGRSLLDAYQLSEAQIQELHPQELSLDARRLIQKYQKNYHFLYESTTIFVERIVEKLNLGVVEHLVTLIEKLKTTSRGDPQLHNQIIGIIDVHFLLDITVFSKDSTKFLLKFKDQLDENSSNPLDENPISLHINQNLLSIIWSIIACFEGVSQTLQNAVMLCKDPESSTASETFKDLQELFAQHHFSLDQLTTEKKKKKKKKKRSSASAAASAVSAKEPPSIVPSAATPPISLKEVEIPSTITSTPPLVTTSNVSTKETSPSTSPSPAISPISTKETQSLSTSALPLAAASTASTKKSSKKTTAALHPPVTSPSAEVQPLSSSDLKQRNFIRRLELLGAYLERQKGDHQMMGHPGLAGPLAVPKHKELKKGLAHKLLETFTQAQQAASEGKKIRHDL